MFRLNDAVRRHQAGQPKPVGFQGVAATITMLSPQKTPDAADAVASVAAVAASQTGSANIPQLVENLRQARALLNNDGRKLIFCPSQWAQLESVSAHWKAILIFLQTTEHGDGHRSGWSA